MSYKISFNHLLSGGEISTADFEEIISVADDMKANPTKYQTALANKKIALVFDKPSLRTRFSFSAAIIEMGGHIIESFANNRKYEEPKDFIRVVQNYCDALVIRTFSDSDIEIMAEHSNIPVINALTDLYHPCQILADLMTLKEVFGKLSGLQVTYIGDTNNILYSLLLMADTLGIKVNYACPDGYKLPTQILAQIHNKELFVCFDNPQEAVKNSNAVYTDVWCSMGFEKKSDDEFEGFQVNEELMEHANDGAVFMHCMPMERGKEVSNTLPDAECSVVFQQSLNRKFVQKAILYKLLKNN